MKRDKYILWTFRKGDDVVAKGIYERDDDFYGVGDLTEPKGDVYYCIMASKTYTGYHKHIPRYYIVRNWEELETKDVTPIPDKEIYREVFLLSL